MTARHKVSGVNRGAEILSKRFARRGEQKRIAEATGVDQGYLSKIARGVRVPGLDVRRLLEEHCGIRMQKWDEPARSEAA